jgi:signal transduction histidine kinase
MPTPYTIVSIGDDNAHARRSSALATVLPRAELERAEQPRHLPPAAAAIVDSAATARIARATGFAGGIVIDAEPGPEDSVDDFRAQGTVFMGVGATPDALAKALSAVVPLSAEGAPTAVHTDLARARQLLAAGEVAVMAQHAFNNPLTALMAEAQMLQMEAATDEVRDAAGRIIALVRRLTEISRSLDGVRDRFRGP